MEVIRHLDDLPDQARGGAVSIGNFDGVHRGHAQLIARLVASAKQVGGPAVVFTFDPHPVRILRPQHCPPPLTWTFRKAELLARLGVDYVVAYPADEALLRLSAREFFDRVVVESLGARAMVEGPNFNFGHNREGDTNTLRQLTTEAGVGLDIVEPVEIEGQMVSSSLIRRLIQEEGKVGRARQLLTAPYRLRGIVTHGAGRGAKLGFPTANIEGIDTLMPAHGVYCGLANIGPQRLPAAINLGPNPTFQDMSAKVEVHVVGYNKTLYGRPLEVDFIDRLRTVRSFDSPEQLIEQVRRDVLEADDTARCFLQGDC